MKLKTKKVVRTYISQFEYKGEILDVLYTGGILSYVFERKGQRYGKAVKTQSKSIRDVMNATMALLINYIETREAVDSK